MTTSHDKNLRLWKIAFANAKDAIGPAVFDFQPVAIQRALIAEQIVTLVNAQDDDEVPDARVREMLNILDQINGQWTGPMTSPWAFR